MHGIVDRYAKNAYDRGMAKPPIGHNNPDQILLILRRGYEKRGIMPRTLKRQPPPRWLIRDLIDAGYDRSAVIAAVLRWRELDVW